jgi:antitoxin ParD1/3/4
MSDDELQADWRKPADRERDIAQAKALREQASQGGLRFEAYLPSGLAEWILDLVAEGVFTDPSEAVFVMLGEQRELEPHADLRQEILKRSLQAALDDPRPSVSLEEFDESMRMRLEAPHSEPAAWIRAVYS